MKTEILPALQYSSYPLKIIETDKKQKASLVVLRKECFRNTYHFFATNTVVNDPDNWDALWFGNYE